MKVAVIDDIDEIRSSLIRLITEYCDGINELYEANSVKSGIHLIAKNRPDIVFLDVELGDGTGMDLLSELRDVNFQVIFITAHDKYALDAFKFSAIDFILKPIHAIDMVNAFNKAKNAIKKESYQQQLDILFSHFNAQQQSQKIVLRNSDAIYFIQIDDIIRCEAEGSYTKFIVKNQKPILISKGLKEYDNLLGPFGFIRTHNSHLANPTKIIKLDKSNGGFLLMENNDIIPVSSRKRDYLIKKLSL